MKKLIMIVALLFTVLPTYAEVGQQSDTDCSAISGAKDVKSETKEETQKPGESTFQG